MRGAIPTLHPVLSLVACPSRTGGVTCGKNMRPRLPTASVVVPPTARPKPAGPAPQHLRNPYLISLSPSPNFAILSDSTSHRTEAARLILLRLHHSVRSDCTASTQLTLFLPRDPPLERKLVASKLKGPAANRQPDGFPGPPVLQEEWLTEGVVGRWGDRALPCSLPRRAATWVRLRHGLADVYTEIRASLSLLASPRKSWTVVFIGRVSVPQTTGGVGPASAPGPSAHMQQQPILALGLHLGCCLTRQLGTDPR
ncbi:hypothetical protein K438DRAFT_77190 [Mycena galopus ATCC 62051]|nr:hypothetical protein K438DRAFT_77190 [Mycena galopus ATCC 62051]